MKPAPLTFPVFNAVPEARMLFRVLGAERQDQPVEILIYDVIGKDPWTGEGTSAKDFATQLDGIRGRDLTLRINSRGGDVFEGFAIYNRLNEWSGNIVAVIDGVAASIASVIAMAADEVRMPKSAQFFIHDAWGFAMGNAQEMRDLATRLDTTSDQIADIYSAKTRKPRSVMRDAMRASTLYTGEQARDAGFADVLLDQPAIYNLSPQDLSELRRVTDARSLQNSAPAPSGGQPRQDPMNKAKIIALLKKHGIQASEDMTNAQLLALLAQLPAAEQAARAEAETFLNAQPNPSTPPAPPVTPPAARPGDVQNADVVQLRTELNQTVAQLNQLRTERDTERRGRIAAAVQDCVNEDRIPANQRDAWVNRAMADETVLNDLRAMPSRPPGAAPLNVDLRAEAAPNDVLNAMDRCNLVMASFMRGNGVSMPEIANASLQKGVIWNQHRNRLLPIMNTNNMPAGLQRQVILQEVIRDFARRTLPLRMFSTVFQNVPLLGTDKVNVPFYDLDTGSSTAFVSGTGYTTIGDTTTATREITIGESATDGDRIYQALGFSSQEIARQPFLNIMQLAALKAEKLASDMVADILGIITAANYGAAAIIKAASAWGSDDLADLKLACKLWPEPGRGLIVDSAIDAELLKDAAFKSALNAASDSAIKQGRLFPQVFGFEYSENPTIPGNSENLIGFAVFRSAILVATAPVPPVEEVRNAGTQYQVVTDPASGVTFEYRTFGNNVTDAATHVIEVNYGFAKGNGNALKRITSA